MKRSELKEKHFMIYEWLKLNNPTLLDQFSPKLHSNKKWSKEECVAISSKMKNVKEWVGFCKKSYEAACRNGWVYNCCKHMSALRKTNTKDDCLREALLCKTKSEWAKKYTSYNTARTNGWIDDCCKHMKETYKKIINIETGEIFLSCREASKSVNRSRSAVGLAVRGGHKCGGYTWEYYDPKKHGKK